LVSHILQQTGRLAKRARGRLNPRRCPRPAVCSQNPDGGDGLSEFSNDRVNRADSLLGGGHRVLDVEGPFVDAISGLGCWGQQTGHGDDGQCHG